MWSNPDLIKLACIVRRQECLYLKVAYLKPARVEVRGTDDDTVFKFYNGAGLLIWQVRRKKLVLLSGKENYNFDPDPATGQCRQRFDGTWLRDEYYSTYCLV